ncbi:Hypothetical protein R9X50_00072200 [Acrodontium crateriforme]|uniref:Large ribosomal subunit protein uL5m n=1 Tax=Acrodontium crateriforme TaxID=150365 RepID=A0AAQ3LY29_9PEZI|nr:Hypothetical protein R9X50_00072200 [Acrodontium crateriforme]
MALADVTTAFLRRVRPTGPAVFNLQSTCRYASSNTSPADAADLSSSPFQDSSACTPSEKITAFDPAARARALRKRGGRLPPSRYQYRPPRYDRGPLHPHQPPPPSDPASRLFEAGPFSLPRLEQTYHDTLASDFMTLSYTHFPPGESAHQKGARLRPWEGESPYYANRALRGPRGGDVLRLLRKPITFNNIPQLQGITVHSMVKGAVEDSAHLHVAGMVLQAITNVRAEAHATRKAVAAFGVRKDQHVSVTCDLKGEDMYHFLSKCVDVVLPKIKDWKGVKGSSGDSSGNIAFGLTSEDVALFPEIEVNYDMYPPKMIPGCHVIVHTTARDDRDARLLLSQIGLPFYGKFIN